MGDARSVVVVFDSVSLIIVVVWLCSVVVLTS